MSALVGARRVLLGRSSVFPRTPILDTFNRADENPLSGGGNWVASPWWGFDLKIASNQVEQASGADPYAGMRWVAAFAGGAEVYATVAVAPSMAGEQLDLELIRTGSADLGLPDGYQLDYGTNTGLRVIRLDGGSFTTLATVALAAVAGDGFWFWYSPAQSRIRVYHRGSNGAWARVIDLLESTHAGPWYLQCGINGGSNTKFDNVGGGSV